MESKNLKYAKVNNHVFSSLHDAEVFCKKNEIDSSFIEYRDDPNLNFTCQQIAKIQVAVLDELKQQFDAIMQGKSEELDRWVKERDNGARWDRDFAQTQVAKCCYEIQGLGAAREAAWKLYVSLMGITGWNDANVYGLKRGECYFKIDG